MPSGPQSSPAAQTGGPTQQQFGLGLLALSAPWLVTGVWLAARHKGTYWPVLLWCAGCALSAIFVGTGAMLSGAAESADSERDRNRIRLLSVGAGIGVFTAILGFLLPFTLYSDVFSGGLAKWRANPGALTWTALALFGGLTLMFVSLQLARGFERTSPNLRRLLYGYNAILGAILLIAVLVLINILPYTRVGPFKTLMRTFDWTQGGLYSLNEKSRNLIAELKQPVTVYVLLTSGDRVTQDVEAMLNTARQINPQVTWKLISRDRMRGEFGELITKYPVQEPDGLIVVYGAEGEGATPQWDFIKYDDLVTEPSMPMRGMPQQSSKYVFKGENALMKTLVYLSEGKTKAVVYFTQGNGELDLNDRGGERFESGMGVLSERIGKSNFEVKPLKFAGSTTEVPADADAVVVVRPGGSGVPMSEVAVKALTDYMEKGAGGKKGKMMVLFDVVALPNGAMLQTGLEPLVEKFGVKVLNDRVLALDERHMFVLGRRPQAVDIVAVANRRATNAIARSYLAGGQPIFFWFENARTVEPAAGAPGASASAEVIVQTPQDLPVISQKDLVASPQAVVTELRKPANREKLEREISEKPVPLAVAVTETKGPPPQMPLGHPPVGAKDSTPRLVVFGDSAWVSNQALNDRMGRTNYDLFLTSLSWLRERPNIGWDAQDKERQDYQLDLKDEDATRLKLLPASLMLLVVLCLAGGVWVVRRR